jgi:hypothetical protein
VVLPLFGKLDLETAFRVMMAADEYDPQINLDPCYKLNSFGASLKHIVRVCQTPQSDQKEKRIWRTTKPQWSEFTLPGTLSETPLKPW